MKERVKVYEKPTCTKCREIKKLLSERGVQYEAINYFEQPMSASTLGGLLEAAGLEPSEAIRENEPAYNEFVAGKELDRDALIEVMAAHPELIQRPIVLRGDKAVLARPAENLSKIGL